MLNNAHSSSASQYYNRERPSIVEQVRPGPNRVLDLGCGAGAVGRKLLSSGKAKEVVGVELFPSAAAEASSYYSQVHCGDIEEMEIPYSDHFDYVLCGDVLEHLKDPYAVVKRIHTWLKNDGEVICSLPNVRYWRVSFDTVCRGEWEYQDSGIMDQTHLRFFTRRSAFRMLRDASFSVEQYRILMFGRKYRLANALTFGLFDEFLGPQVVLRARKGAARP